MRSSKQAGFNRVSGVVAGVGAALIAGLTMAAAQSQVALAAVDAIVEALTPMPPPASPPSPTLPAGTPVAERRVFLIPPGSESRLPADAPKAPPAFVEPFKTPGVNVEGPLPTRVRVGREDPAMCSAQCQLTINAGLRGCDGNVNLEALTRAGKPLPLPSCRLDLVTAYRACMAGCGFDLPEPPPVTTMTPPPRRIPEAGRP